MEWDVRRKVGMNGWGMTVGDERVKGASMNEKWKKEGER